MAEIAPFRGILYNPKRADLSKVLAPPYDVIDAEERATLAAQGPHNCVRLILPEGEGDAKYLHAAETMQGWLDEEVLVRDLRPAIYRYHQVFTVAELGRTFTRRGFITAVRLYDLAEGVVRPHERTHAGPKVDRLKLMESTRAHLSQVFAMYSDPSGRSDEVFKGVERGNRADLDETTADGTRHILWRVPDAEVIGSVRKLMAPLKLYIADGHHRYETMLAYRNQLREQAGSILPTKSAGEFGVLFLSNMDQEGLVIRPTHRLLHDVPDFDGKKVVEKAAEFFDITTLKAAASDAAKIHTAVADAASLHPSFAAILAGEKDVLLFSLKGSVNVAALGVTGPRVVTDLDVTLLHELVLGRVIGIGRGEETMFKVEYLKDTDDALGRIAAGEGQMCFIMNPTRLHQVRAVADAGEVMPEKSTFFYPKIASGVVFSPIDPKEQLG